MFILCVLFRLVALIAGPATHECYFMLPVSGVIAFTCISTIPSILPKAVPAHLYAESNLKALVEYLFIF